LVFKNFSCTFALENQNLMERIVFDEIVKIDKVEQISITISLRMISRFCPIELVNDDENRLFYSCKIDELLKSDITEDELIQAVSEGHWEVSEDKNNFILKL